MAEWWEAAPLAPKQDKPAEGGNWWDAAPKAKPSSFSDRLQKVWDKPSPGGLLSIVKQGVEAIGGIGAAQEALTKEPHTEEDFWQQDQARNALPSLAMQAASLFSPGAPKGTGGVFAAPMRESIRPAAEPVAQLPAVIGGPTVEQLARNVPKGPDVVDAAQRLSGVVGSDVEVPRAISTDSMAAQRVGQAIRNVPVVGDAIPKATGRLVEGLSDATRTIADQYGQGTGPNVANRIGRTVQEMADEETRAAEAEALRSNEAVTAAWQRDTNAAHAQIAQRETQSLQAAREAVGDMTPHDMSAALIERLRMEEGAARANKEGLYERAGAMDASVRADEVGKVRAVVAQGLEDAGTVVDKDLTPAASKMLDELQRLTELVIPNKAVGARVPASGTEERVAVTVQGIEQARKRLNFFRSAASNPADQRAASQIMRHFDEWQAQAFENALLSGDEAALTAFRHARAANTSWRQRFFNDETDAGNIITRIVTGEVTPQEVANYLIGAGQVGAKGVSSRLLTEIGAATGNDPQVMRTIGGGVWNKLSQAIEGTGAKAPEKVARDIMEFLNGSGRTVAERLYTPEQRRIMRAYADTLRNGQAARDLIGEVAAATKPTDVAAVRGPMRALADAVVGKGGKADEALFRAVDGYAKSGGRADIATLGKLTQALPQQERNDLAGAIIRNLGISPKTGQWSPDVFVSQWSTYTPQAKAILFGNAGAQRKALDDIALISARLKEVAAKFGNPSGTGQTGAAFALGSAAVTGATAAAHGDFVTPLGIIGGLVGGAAAAKVLASPAGSSSVLKWAKAYLAMVTKPSPASTSLFKVASRNLANTSASLGVQLLASDLMQTGQSKQDGQSQTSPRR